LVAEVVDLPYERAERDKRVELRRTTTTTVQANMSDSSDNYPGLGNVTDVDLTTADPTAVTCFIQSASNSYDGGLGVRISALFVILVVSTAVTFFPVLATRSKKLRIPLYVYLFARYFGAGVIIATAFIQ
jgi:hypothetical protein